MEICHLEKLLRIRTSEQEFQTLTKLNDAHKFSTFNIQMCLYMREDSRYKLCDSVKVTKK